MCVDIRVRSFDGGLEELKRRLCSPNLLVLSSTKMCFICHVGDSYSRLYIDSLTVLVDRLGGGNRLSWTLRSSHSVRLPFMSNACPLPLRRAVACSVA